MVGSGGLVKKGSHFFFLKKENQGAICLAYFVRVHVYTGIAWGEGPCHAMRQKQDDFL